MKKVLIINSAKGGVGKTEVATGIAKELANRMNNPVAVLDMDVTTPNMEKIDGIELYSSPTNMVMNKSQIKKLIKSTFLNMEDGWLIIDTPPIISDIYFAILEVIKDAKFLFVTTPSSNAVKDTGIGIRFFVQRGVIPIGLIQNMVGGVFGNAINSSEEMGINTIAEIPLTKETSPYFKEIVNYIESVDFDNITIEDDRKILSNVTLEEINEPGFPLQFYNLETWDTIRELILEEVDFMNGLSKSHYDISTESLSKIIDEGDHTMVMIRPGLSVQNAPLPYEIQYADIVYDHKISKGLPMFKLQNGVYLWHHECIMVSDEEIKVVLDDGGFNVSSGRIIQSLFNQMYLNRAYTRNAMSYEYELIKRHIQETSSHPDKKDLIYAIYLLKKDGDLSYEDFEPLSYIENNIEYDDFYKHIKNVYELGK